MPGGKRVISKRSKIAAQIGRSIRQKREQQGLSQERLAELAELSKNYVGNVERGESELSVSTLIQLTKALNFSASELLRSFGF